MTTPRYMLRVNPRRYRDLYERLESIEEGERSWWMLQALLEKLAAEQGPDIKLKTEQPEYSPSIIPVLAETAVTNEEETNEVESKLDQFARMF